MTYLYDFIDNAAFLKDRQKKNSLLITEFDRLKRERDQFYRKYLFNAWCISNGNIAAMCRGLDLNRKSLISYLTQVYGAEYKQVLNQYVIDMKLEIK